MLNIYVLFLITLCIICIMQPKQTKVNVVTPQITKEGFSRKFFSNITPTYFVGMDFTQMTGNAFLMVNLVKKMIPYDIDTVMIKDSIDRYQYLNENRVQFIMSRAHTLHNVIYKTMPGLANISITNVRYVMSLYRISLNILTCSLRIGELGDLIGSGLCVSIGPKYSSDYFFALDLFIIYGITVGKDIIVKNYDVVEAFGHYGVDLDVVFISVSHPDANVGKFIEKKLSRFVEIKKYNDGNIYQISLNEAPFYKEHPYYLKTVLDKRTIQGYYPNLVLNQQDFDPDTEVAVVVGQSLFINTISTRYNILSNTKTPDKAVQQLIYNMKLNLAEINKLEFINEKLDAISMAEFNYPIQTHSGAHEYYFRSGLYTNISNKNCVYIDGKCSEDLLYDYHMVNDFGKTFDQIYNSEKTYIPYSGKYKLKTHNYNPDD